jgi:hypothetical protein
MLCVDHIEPVAEGGSSDDANLLTSCYPCNIGKGGRFSFRMSRSGGKPRRKPGRPKKMLAEELTATLSETGPQTATQLSQLLKKNRTQISHALNSEPQFLRVCKEGKDVFYGLHGGG